MPCSRIGRSTSAKELQAAHCSGISGVADANGCDFALELIRVRAKKADVEAAASRTRAEKPRIHRTRESGTRKISWGSRERRRANLSLGITCSPAIAVDGLAVLEGVNTTYLVPDGWTMFVDRFGNGAC